MLSCVNFCVRRRLFSVPMLRYKSKTHFWSERCHDRSPHKTPASVIFWHFKSHWSFNWLFLICRSLSVSSVLSSIAISYFGSAGSRTIVGFGWRNVSSVMFSHARMASFNWMRHFSYLIWGSEIARSQNGSIDSGVFRDSRADCALSYRFRYRIRSEIAVPKYRIYRS